MADIQVSRAGTVDGILAAGHDLATMHRDATRELGKHWPDEIGVCTGCGDDYPCSEEWATIKLISVIESHWRRAGQHLAELTRSGDASTRVNPLPSAT